jgi:hypothetical protein
VVEDNARLHGELSPDSHAKFLGQLSATPSSWSSRHCAIDTRWDDSLELTENPALLSTLRSTALNNVAVSPMSPTRKDSMELSPTVQRRRREKQAYLKRHKSQERKIPSLPMEAG